MINFLLDFNKKSNEAKFIAPIKEEEVNLFTKLIIKHIICRR